MLPLELVNRRHLRSADDIEGDGLVGVTAEAPDFEIAKPGVDRVAQRRRWLRWSLKAEHPPIPHLDGQPVAFLARLGGPLRRGPDRRAVDALA